MNKKVDDLRYEATLRIYPDGACVVTGDSIRGLVVEASRFDKLRSELIHVAPRLLRLNHGLTDEEITRVVLHVTVYGEVDPDDRGASEGQVNAFGILWDDKLQLALACA